MSVDISWNHIKFSIDLIEKALNHLEFLEAIDKLKPILCGEILKKSIYRYEKLWLNLYLKHVNVTPPLDVLWIWHCHMLNPIQYNNDLKNNKYQEILNRITDHTNSCMKAVINGQEISKLIWESELNCSYEFLDSNSSVENAEYHQNYKTNFKYDLYEASKRQFEFYYQVALPHYKSREYLQLAVDRYKKFLHLKQQYPYLFIVPCYSIDLIWHTHQLNPYAYASDTIELLGAILDHDDSVVNRNAGEKLDVSSRETQQLWKELYNENFFLSGSEFRGIEPTNEFYSDFELPEYKLANFQLNRISMKSKNQENVTFKLTIHKTYVNEHNIVLADHLINESKQEETQSLDLYASKSTEFVLTVELVDKFGSKISNLFKSGHRHNDSFDNKFMFKVDFPTEMNSVQNYAFDLDGPNEDKIQFALKWNLTLVDNKAINEIAFTIHRNEFKKVNMNEIRSEYRNFFVDSFHFVNDEAIRAEHKIIPAIWIHNQKVTYESEAYTAEILHIVGIQWSSIRVLKGDRILASSKLINLQQLPSDELKLDKDYISLNPKYERAMIVSNLNGDYAFIKAKWNYSINKKDQKKFGYLTVYFYSFSSKKVQTLNVTNSSEFIFKNDANNLTALVNLKTGSIKITTIGTRIQNLEIESLMATLISISILYCLGSSTA